MRVLFNMLVARGRKTGIGLYASELLRSLREEATAERFDEFPGSWLGWCWGKGSRLRPWLEARKKSDAATVADGRTTVGARLRRGMVGALRQAGEGLLGWRFRSASRRQYDVYHEPNYIPFATDVPTVATIHDLSILLYPEWHPADRVVNFERRFERALGQCAHFVAVSEATRQDFLRMFNVPAERVTRTYNGVRPGLMPLPGEMIQARLRLLGLPERYLLYVGTIEPRKNVLMLLRAYADLPAELRRDWPLLLVGGWGWNAADVRTYLETHALRAGVIHLGYLPDEDVATVYNGARALVYPSFYEGFGLPPTEMLACGGAVLASTAAALVETVGHKAHLISPHDQAGWTQAMRLVVEDDDWWQGLRQGATEAVRMFTWRQCALDTLRVYQSLTGQTRSAADRTGRVAA